MPTQYDYSLTATVPAGSVRLDQLRDELNSVLTTDVLNVSYWSDNIRIITRDPMSPAEETATTDTLTAHVPQTVKPTIPTVELVDGDGDTSIRLETNQYSDEDVVIIKTDGTDRVTFGGINYDSKVFKTTDNTGSDWMQHQFGNEGSAYTVMFRSLGTIETPQPLTGGTKVGGYAFGLEDGNNGNTPRYGAEIAAYALGDQSPTNGGAELRIGLTRENTKGRQQVMALTADDVRLHAYPNTRTDGTTTKALYVDEDGFVKHGPVVLAPVAAAPAIIRLHNAGRMYCYSDDRWISADDDSYGHGYYQWAESGGTGVNPIQEWEHGGKLVRAGEKLKNFSLQGRSNNTSVVELEYLLSFRRPDSPARFLSGVDSDGEMNNTDVLRDFWVNNSAGGWAGATNDMHRRDKLNIDYTFPEDGMLTLYLKATNTSTNTRYMYLTYSYDIEV